MEVEEATDLRLQEVRRRQSFRQALGRRHSSRLLRRRRLTTTPTPPSQCFSLRRRFALDLDRRKAPLVLRHSEEEEVEEEQVLMRAPFAEWQRAAQRSSSPLR